MSEWIKCTDRMPEIDKWILVYSENIGDEPNIIACFLSCYKGLDRYISHWMPLPQRPE